MQSLGSAPTEAAAAFLPSRPTAETEDRIGGCSHPMESLASSQALGYTYPHGASPPLPESAGHTSSRSLARGLPWVSSPGAQRYKQE